MEHRVGQRGSELAPIPERLAARARTTLPGRCAGPTRRLATACVAPARGFAAGLAGLRRTFAVACTPGPASTPRLDFPTPPAALGRAILPPSRQPRMWAS